MLREEFEKEPNLDSTRKAALARRTQLSEKQVYKWFWEERTKRTAADATPGEEAGAEEEKKLPS